MSTPFIEALVAAMPTPQARLACLSVLARWAGSSVYIPAASKAERRQCAAAHMLNEGVDPGDAARILRERFGISERTAWRDVKTARKMARGNGTAG